VRSVPQRARRFPTSRAWSGVPTRARLSLLVSSCAASFWRSVLNWAALLVARAAACPSQRCFFLRASHPEPLREACRVASDRLPRRNSSVAACSAAVRDPAYLSLGWLMHVRRACQAGPDWASWSSFLIELQLRRWGV